MGLLNSILGISDDGGHKETFRSHFLGKAERGATDQFGFLTTEGGDGGGPARDEEAYVRGYTGRSIYGTSTDGVHRWRS